MTYRDIFGVDADPQATVTQDAKHAVAVASERRAGELLRLAAQNDRYAAEYEATAARTNGERGLHMAQVCRDCAARQRAQAERLFPAYVVVD